MIEITFSLSSVGIYLNIENDIIEHPSLKNPEFLSQYNEKAFENYIDKLRDSVSKGIKNYNKILLRKAIAPLQSVSRSLYNSLNETRPELDNEGKPTGKKFPGFTAEIVDEIKKHMTDNSLPDIDKQFVINLANNREDQAKNMYGYIENLERNKEMNSLSR